MEHKALKILGGVIISGLILLMAYLTLAPISSKNNIYRDIQSAVFNNDISKVASLLSKNSIDLNNESLFMDLPLFVAVDKGNYEMVELLVDNGADINKQVLRSYSNVLELAILNSPEMIDTLIDRGYKINTKNSRGDNALTFALKFNCNINTVKSLIEHGIDLKFRDDYNTNYLHFAAQAGSKEIYDYLLTFLTDAEKEKNIDNETVLHFAASSDSVDMFKNLLSKGFNINEKDKYGRTVLHKFKSKKMLKFLLDEVSLDVNERTTQGDTPIFRVLEIDDEDERMECMKFVIDKGWDIHTQTNVGTSLIHKAASMGDYECIKLLIDNGIDVNVCDSSNVSALHIAASLPEMEDTPKIVRLLLDSGANKTIRDSNGMTPLAIAVSYGNEEIINLLK